MKLTKGHDRFINNKSMGVSFLKGKKESGKPIASIYRAINIENNYCLFESFIKGNFWKKNLRKHHSALAWGRPL